MKRWIWRALVFLLIGAVINVAVAWGCAYRHGGGPHMATMGAPLAWPVGVPANWPAPMACGIRRATGYQWELGRGWERREERGVSEHGIPWVNTVTDWTQADVIRAGWPLLALESRLAERTAWAWMLGRADGERVRMVGWNRGLEVWDNSGALGSSVPTVIPLMPRWPQFIANTLVWTMAWCVLFFGARALRARRRDRTGLCPHCAYPIGMSAVCSECGRSVKPGQVSA